MTPKKKRPAPREFDLLRALWELGPSRVRDVREHLEARGRSLAYNTVQTLLNRLVEKGQVRVDQRGSAFVYRAARKPESVVRARVKEFLDETFEGSALPLLSHLVRDGGLRPDEVRELSELLDEEARRKRR